MQSQAETSWLLAPAAAGQDGGTFHSKQKATLSFFKINPKQTTKKSVLFT